jgi:hypothetical protein
MGLQSTKSLTEMSTRNLPGGDGRPVHTTNNLTVDCLENVGASMSHNPMGLHGLLRDSFTFYLFIKLKVESIFNWKIHWYIKWKLGDLSRV